MLCLEDEGGGRGEEGAVGRGWGVWGWIELGIQLWSWVLFLL